ncbi:MAG: glycosyltransferase family 4 protein [Alphaproteobacteria bacterium]|nr:glycosyltransferase family 4 protein [Alphaproteobacteria bacterium]MCD8520117.1 glycosyltransferase family 4 protein [Alphaproteobacteria bacterium]MCD8525936.1 glycosyltransferase family 4 protein [Alphaproteobacteria bacterium]MCD8571094.1 glycosyltransferase family 4 protein [Alphaproteobacteria bacterium]
MQKRKRPELFLEIARLLKNHAPDQFKFIMAGAFYDDYEARLKTLAQHYNLENDLTFTGFVNDPQKILAGFDILIAPAENEAFGRVLVEAMALGVPVIASKSGGHVEIIEDGKTGFLCTPDEAQSFADKVITLQNDAALKERITEAALAESKKYEASEIARRFEEIYEGVLS